MPGLGDPSEPGASVLGFQLLRGDMVDPEWP